MMTVEETICRIWRDDLSRSAAWRCALATIAAAPLSFFGMLYVTWDSNSGNPAGVIVYFFLCLVLIVPLALVNSFLTAPWVAKVAGGRFSAVGSHLILVAVWLGCLLGGRLFFWCLGALRFPPELGWLLGWPLIFLYLTMLLGPAAIAGSFVYSLKYNSMRRERALCK